MYCQSCGRDNQCVHTINYGFKDQLFLLIMVMALPSIINGIYFNIFLDFDKVNYLQTGAISISVSLVILLIAYYYFNKLYIAIFFGCHQRVDRSMTLRNKPFVLCARCTGIMFGMFSTFFISLFTFSYWWLFLFIIPMIVDGVIQKRTNYESNNLKRFFTGFLAGPSFVLIFGFLHFLLSKFIVTTVLNII